ncbi:HAD family hydrolase [Glacieibacterium frigidum]|uniref:HAD family phosphatase n=1 Tax=Glacieibacterium frigidum TaxID=2593303 RepID=A0A552U7J5_9SPHN|nr:HAD family phosphatase [Glacieibacterium frigidum]TRW14180.1 HAD family phosphatase [Glacieibacterium frigidum]
MPVTTVVFDVGHVLYDWDPLTLYAKLIPDAAELEWFLATVVTREWHFQHDAGRAFSDTSAELSGQYPAYAPLIAAYGPRWLETIPGPMPGMLELVEELAARDVPLFAITNFSDEFWAMFRPTAPVFDHFLDVIVSGTERMVKPDRPIFELAMRRFGLAPGEALFVDDRADNVRGGESVGLIGHVFDGEPGLRARLVALGLL